MDKKVVVTHWGALRAKYGAAGLAEVRRAIDALVAADAQRGLGTRVIGLDSAAEMRPFRAQPMGKPDDFEGAKRAVDAIDGKLLPHYILILGSPDVVPMQRLENYAGYIEIGERGDQDPNVYSDLPYACDMPFSRDPADFQGPTRVVGRLPDVPEARNPEYLLRVLGHAAKAQPLTPADYEEWFALSAHAWRKSSKRTLRALFGKVRTRSLHLSPPASPAWTQQDLAPRMHFVNCHGSLDDSGYYGDDGTESDEDFIAMVAARLRDRITPGTVLVAECCYGAQLYEPQVARVGAGRRILRGGIAMEYLRQGAYGVFGSTSIAYGNPDTNEYADHLCRYFVERLRAGASLGRAVLEARQRYVRFERKLDPIALKTLMQFFLLGDPSIHPIAKRGAATRSVQRQAANRALLVSRQRERRRERAHAEGRAMAQAAGSLRREGVTPEVSRQMLKIAEEFGMRTKAVRFFTLWANKADYERGLRTRDARAGQDQFAVLLDVIKDEMGIEAGKARVPRRTIVVAKLRRGRVVGIRRAVSH